MSAATRARSICFWRSPAPQKVDIAKISILALAEQYIQILIAEAQNLKLELAADYLVMAARLAYLKSRPLLPREDKQGDEPPPRRWPAVSPFRLMRLDAMRRAGRADDRKRLGRDVFPRGMPEGTKSIRETEWTAEIVDLPQSICRSAPPHNQGVSHVVKARSVWSIKEARTRLERLVGESVGDWVVLEDYMKTYLAAVEKTVPIASSFGATLEMAREGMIELKQEAPFAPIYMRKCEAGAEWQLLSNEARTMIMTP